MTAERGSAMVKKGCGPCAIHQQVHTELESPKHARGGDDGSHAHSTAICIGMDASMGWDGTAWMIITLVTCETTRTPPTPPQYCVMRPGRTWGGGGMPGGGTTDSRATWWNNNVDMIQSNRAARGRVVLMRVMMEVMMMRMMMMEGMTSSETVAHLEGWGCGGGGSHLADTLTI